MARRLSTKFLATALALSPLMLVATTPPAAAQVNFSVSIGTPNYGSVNFGYFYNQLAPYGRWYRHPRWGDVWHPVDVPRDFRPYYHGHWDYTGQYGWLWQSDYEWGDVAFHYGRWVYDPYDGWLWIPGYVWSPAWVIWREGGGNIGWFPMPPDDRFLAGDEVYRTNWDDYDRGSFGYTNWYGPQYGAGFTLGFWTFVDQRHFADRDYIRYAPRREEYRTYINNTRNVTNYTTVNNVIVNRSVDVRQIERASGRRVAEVNPRDFARNAPITPVDTGRQVQVEERRQHGGDPRANARDRVAVLPPQTFTPTSPPTNGALPNQQPGGREGAGGRGRGGPGFIQPNQPQVQPNPPPPNPEVNIPPGRGRGGPGFIQPNQPQGQPNPPPPNPEANIPPGRGRGGQGFIQPNQPPQVQPPPPNPEANIPPGRGRGGQGFIQPNQPQQVQPPPPNPEANIPPGRGRGGQGFIQPNQPPQGQAIQGPPPRGGNGPPQPPPERAKPFQPPPPAAPPSQANIQRGRPPEAAPPPPPQAAPPPQVQRGAPPNAQGGPPPNNQGDNNRGRGRGKNQDDQNK